mmetsp:Transcript_10644/g.22178  ORF Transcript_10644/g.22178 Transcript_10644/m.22178 type:complete len:202 (+) Transcript_10644:217-822(+)
MERDLLVGQLSIHGGVGVSASLHIGLVATVKINLEDAASVDLAAGTLSSDLGGVYDVFQNGILDSSESAGTRTKSRCLLGTSVALSENVALSDNDDMLAGEFLLQLTDKTSLDLLERLLEFVRDVDDDGLASCSAVDFLRSSDVKITKRGLQLRGGHLKVKEFLSDTCLELIRLGASGFLDFLVAHDGGYEKIATETAQVV